MYYWSVSYHNWLWHFDRWEEAAPARQITCCTRPNTKTEVTFTWLMFKWKSMLNAEKTYDKTSQDTSSFGIWVEVCLFLTCEKTVWTSCEGHISMFLLARNRVLCWSPFRHWKWRNRRRAIYRSNRKAMVGNMDGWVIDMNAHLPTLVSAELYLAYFVYNAFWKEMAYTTFAQTC